MKDYILNNINMKDILYKYGIKTNKDMFHCPFHKDKNASAKAYENSFFCFSCHKTGDVIQFVQYLYNLNFKEAMQKINEDFHLGLDSNTKVDYSKINRIKRQREEKERYKNKLMQDFIRQCDLKQLFERVIKNVDKQMNIINLANMMQIKIQFQDEIWKTENEIEKIEKKMANI